MSKFDRTSRKLISAACFGAAAASFVAGSLLPPQGMRPLTNEALRMIEGADNNWKKIEDRTCVVQTLSDFNGSTDPATRDKAKGVVLSCTDDDVTASATCWQCDANPAPTHTVYTGGGSMEGNDYTPKACGRLLQGTCKTVDGSPKCFGAVAQRGFDCTTAQQRVDQAFPMPTDPLTP